MWLNGKADAFNQETQGSNPACSCSTSKNCRNDLIHMVINNQGTLLSFEHVELNCQDCASTLFKMKINRKLDPWRETI